MENTPSASHIQNQSRAQRSRFHPKKTRQGNGTPGLQMSHNVQLRLRVVCDQNVNHVLIRVRHCSRTSLWVSNSVGRSPNHSRPRTSTRWSRPHLGNSLPLAPSDQFPTETDSLLICDGDRVGLVLGRHVQVCLPNVFSTSCERTASLSPAPCVRVEIFALIRLLLALFLLSRVLGSQSLAVFLHGSLGPNPWLCSFLHVHLGRVSSWQDVVVTLIAAE